MKIFLADGLTCKCKSPNLSLVDMALHKEGLYMHGFHLSIYFYCPDCKRSWFHRVNVYRVRIFIKQHHVENMYLR